MMGFSFCDPIELVDLLNVQPLKEHLSITNTFKGLNVVSIIL
jgi:hypothetical protein